jgi:hypothetical protein
MYPSTQIVSAAYLAVPARMHAAASTHAAAVSPASLDVEMFLGFVAVLATLLCYLERRRSSTARFALGVCLLLTAAFGFERGAWPLGLLQIVWAGVAFVQWWTTGQSQRARTPQPIKMIHRRTELFGSTFSNN